MRQVLGKVKLAKQNLSTEGGNPRFAGHLPPAVLSKVVLTPAKQGQHASVQNYLLFEKTNRYVLNGLATRARTKNLSGGLC